MASEIKITVGATSASFVPQATDQQAGKAFNSFYTNYQLGPESATNQQKLLACAQWFGRYVNQRAKQQYHEEQEPVTAAEADVIYGVPVEP